MQTSLYMYVHTDQITPYSVLITFLPQVGGGILICRP